MKKDRIGAEVWFPGGTRADDPWRKAILLAWSIKSFQIVTGVYEVLPIALVDNAGVVEIVLADSIRFFNPEKLKGGDGDGE